MDDTKPLIFTCISAQKKNESPSFKSTFASNRGDCPNFEPTRGIIEPFVAALLLPPPPYLIQASQMLQGSV